MFARKGKSLPKSGVPESFSTPASLVNFRLGWQGLPGTNTIAYLAHSELKKVKICTILAPEWALKSFLTINL
jgi:hypothetical protein